MSVLVYTENWKGKFRKSTFEAVSYANELAKLLATDVVALSFGEVSDEELNKLGNYGASKVLSVSGINKGDSQQVANIFAKNAADASIIIFASTYTSKMIAPRLSAKLKIGIASNVISLPSSTSPITISRKAFSGKAIEKTIIKTEKAILTLAPNAFGLVECVGSCSIEKINTSENASVLIEGEEITRGKISLAEAEIIVSAGRGLKGAENWGMVEELAELLGAATACSKPVADIGWRPHEEHVGQTGKAVAPNLYIAIGISGAIQHLAGVNSSKVMVVINTDAEAPFFKAADYGIVGDAFQIVPKLIEEIKKAKN
ncbi:MAG: electron transfer flavoprotein subunit alpha/FixB family protein [Flavobacteriales bacterium]|nr:electron transfer flavoprotein subunit alpha/FixB family protein [Flavobacteriales bacterium]